MKRILLIEKVSNRTSTVSNENNTWYWNKTVKEWEIITTVFNDDVSPDYTIDYRD